MTDQRKQDKRDYDRRRYIADPVTVLLRVQAAYDPVKKSAYDKSRKVERSAQLRHRYRTDINYRLRCNLRSRLNGALRGNRKSAATMRMLGCSVEELRVHLESLFTVGMTWLSVLDGSIHIDHIRPCVAFDLSEPAQQRICFHFTNLQPLWAQDNRRKYTKH